MEQHHARHQTIYSLKFRIMRKFKLYVVESGELTQEICVECFVNAETKAKELLNEVWPNCPCDDTYIECVENNSDRWFDHIILTKDCCGETCWMTLVMGEYGPLSIRPLNEIEEYEMDVWRNEKELHISDLNEDELKKLRHQVCVGSCYLSDFANTFGIDENEVCDLCEEYDVWCEVEDIEDTADNFAFYVLEIA